MTESAATLVRQREQDDCTVCCISMATGLSYETVMAVARNARGGYRYGGRPGTGSPKAVLLELGYDARWIQVETVPTERLRLLIWGRRAILSVASLNGYAGHHDVYWDGEQVRDPTNGSAYPSDIEAVTPLVVTIIKETATP